MSQPEWNSLDPRGSLQAFGEFFHEHARATFLQDATHVEILFILATDGTMQPVPIAQPMTREGVAETLREQIPGSGVYGLIHIAEAWGYLSKGKRDHTFKQLSWGEMRVSDLKSEDKIELLVVSLLSRDEDQMAWVDEIVREKGDTVRLGRSVQLTHARFPLGDVFKS
jgi:hypothetical protein